MADIKFQLETTTKILSSLPMDEADEFLHMIRMTFEEKPEILPEKWGWGEPESPFSLDRLPDLIPTVAQRLDELASIPKVLHSGRPLREGMPRMVFFEKRKPPKVFGSFAPRGGVNDRISHSSFSLDQEFRDIDQKKQVRFLKKASAVLEADFGFLDVLTPEYKVTARKNGAGQYGSYGITTHVLRIWLPDIFWATVLGPPYVALFGKERLLSAPAAIVEELQPDLIYIQLTNRLADAVEDPAGLMDRRQAFKDHVGMEAFYDPTLGIEYGDLDDNPVFARAEKPYRLRPVFDFSRY